VCFALKVLAHVVDFVGVVLNGESVEGAANRLGVRVTFDSEDLPRAHDRRGASDTRTAAFLASLLLSFLVGPIAFALSFAVPVAPSIVRLLALLFTFGMATFLVDLVVVVPSGGKPASKPSARAVAQITVAFEEVTSTFLVLSIPSRGAEELLRRRDELPDDVVEEIGLEGR